MRASAFVGRVGGLAVALGIGAMAGGFGLAVATASPSDSPAGSDATNAESTRSDAGRPSQATRSLEEPPRKPAAVSQRTMVAAKGSAKPSSIPSAGAQAGPGVPAPLAAAAAAWVAALAAAAWAAAALAAAWVVWEAS